jgi:hypothetical protein
VAVADKADDLAEVILDFYERGWTDGLPIVPPTRQRVDRLIDAVQRPPEDLVGLIPPKWGGATIERLAVNAVMAGCYPEHFPVVVAAIEALLDDRFNLHGVQCTTHVVAPLIVVNGPVAKAISMNSGHNCFGQGWVANAVIGRAVRLALVNLGGAYPGRIDKATFGHPGKYTYCIAENESDSPWDPLHVDAGLRGEDSAVTVFAAEAPHNVNNHNHDPYRLLDGIAGTMRTLGANNYYVMGEYFVVLGVDHARIIKDAGWQKHNVQRYLFESARQSVGTLRHGGMYGTNIERNLWPRWVDRANPDALVPPAREAEDIKIVVAGGAGPHSLVIPGWGTRSVTRKIGV